MKNTHWILGAVLGFGLGTASFAGTLATVNGKLITDEDFKAVTASLPQAQKDLASKDPNTRKQILSDLIDQELVIQEAVREKIEDTREFKEAMASMRKQALVNAIVARRLAPKVTPQAVKDFFEKRKYRYSTDQVRAQHILVSTEKEAQAVLAEVKKPGVDFQKIAELRSKDPTAKNTRGDLGFFSRNTFDSAFSDAAFAARNGEIVGPVKTAFGFHVIKVIDRKLGKAQDFGEVEQAVRADFQRELLKGFVLDLRKKAKIRE
jgi:peptidyl-prolyl cis-trans isomerase C